LDDKKDNEEYNPFDELENIIIIMNIITIMNLLEKV